MELQSFRNQVRKKNTKLFLTPGPAAIHHSCLENIGPCFGRGDEEFLKVYKEVKNWILKFSEQDQLIVSQGSSSFSIEMAIKSMAKKDKALVIDSGYYAARLAVFAKKAGFQTVDILKDGDDLETLVRGPYDWILGTYVETSVGIKNDISKYRSIADLVGAKLFLDSTASIGLEINHGMADCIAFSSCKGLLGLTGGSFLAYKKDANLLEETDSWYQSIKTHRDRMMTGPYHVIQSLSGIMKEHPNLRSCIQRAKEDLQNKVRKSDSHSLVTDPVREPLICTKIKGDARVLYPKDAIHYIPRVLQKGHSLVCHFSELYYDF